ncbi:hypothetical protein AA0Z99_05715 [Agrococcus sp. 1P02AA]|uniref:hypothetical protein n=1 Tax=Agrococcus sp. 1P02AA TaxID=3132259 RepID=UPI0039A54D95
MSAPYGREADMRAAAQRLRSLLSEVEGAATSGRSEPGCQHQIDVCDEIEAIVNDRLEACEPDHDAADVQRAPAGLPVAM